MYTGSLFMIPHDLPTDTELKFPKEKERVYLRKSDDGLKVKIEVTNRFLSDEDYTHAVEIPSAYLENIIKVLQKMV